MPDPHIGPSDEIGQLGVIVKAMSGLHDKGRRRVMAYLVDRYGDGRTIKPEGRREELAPGERHIPD